MTDVTAPVKTRAAIPGDLDPMLRLAQNQRSQYATHQPIFWRPAADALERQRPYFAELIADEQVITIVAEDDRGLCGFAIATLVQAPPVYDPGGPTCLVDDFTVDDAERWPSVGVELLRAVRNAARQRGAAQVVVVCGYLDRAKRRTLEDCGLSIASEWWVSALDSD